MIPLSPAEQVESDRALARKDPRHRAKQLEEKINSALRKWWWSVSRWALAKSKRKQSHGNNLTEYRKLVHTYTRSEAK